MVTQLKNILVLDDEHNITHILKDILEKNGFSVRIFLNGFDAIEIIKKMNFDFVLTDIQMPEINGVEVLKKIKNMNQSIKVIMMTGYASEELQNKAITEGAECILSKPININNLLHILKK